MKKDIFTRQYLGELEGMKKMKMLLYTNQVQNRKTDEAANTTKKINFIVQYIEKFPQFMEGLDEEFSRAEIEEKYMKVLDSDYEKLHKKNTEYLGKRDYKSSLEATLYMEQIEEFKNHFGRYLNLVEDYK